jgi:endo-1,4-beta-xylanase
MKLNKIFLSALLTVFIGAAIISCASNPAGSGDKNKQEKSTENTGADNKKTEEPKMTRPAVLQPLSGDKFVGNIWPNSKGNDPLFTTLWNQVTPENGGKWGLTEPNRDEMRWANMDAAYKVARENNFPVRLHTLVWGNQQPAWIAGLPAGEQLEEVEEWIRLAAERYPDIDMIDVVNEPLHETPSYAEALGGKGTSGWDWVIKSFELARKYFPDAILCINDYAILAGGKSVSEYISIIKLLQARNLIDGIGMQGHFMEHTSLSTVQFTLDRMAELGLPLYITEFDLDYSDDIMQAVQMRDMFSVFYEHDAVKGITFWGYEYGWMWRKKAFLVNKDGTPRPALYWLEAYLKNKDYQIPRSKNGALMGSPERVIIEAEDYTQAKGVEKTDNYLSNIDDGGSIKFEKIAIRMQYSKLTVRYAKASETPAALIIRIGAADGEVAAKIDLAGTGGEDNFIEAIAEYDSDEEGFFDIYVECEGEIGKLDTIILGLGHTKTAE